jgi:hypothetical protein
MSHVQSTFDDLQGFVATATTKGWIGTTSGNAIQTTLRRIKPVLEEPETQNVASIDPKAVIHRFANLNRDVGGASLNSYRSRLASAIKMFMEWRSDPTRWKPRSQPSTPSRRSVRNAADEANGVAEPKNGGGEAVADTDQGRLVYPFPVRPGMVMKFVGLPPDLNQNDVERISRFLRVLCID